MMNYNQTPAPMDAPSTLSKQSRVEGIQFTLFGQILSGSSVVELEDWRPVIPHICPNIPEVVFLSEETVHYIGRTNRKASRVEIENGSVKTDYEGHLLIDTSETVAACRLCGKLFLQG